MPREPQPNELIRFAAESIKFNPFDIEAAEGGKRPSFRMLGYSGGFMDLGFGRPVVVDLAGSAPESDPLPILIQHGYLGFNATILDAILGHSTEVKVDSKVRATGTISGSGPTVDRVVTLAANGFPFQASLGARVRRWEAIEEGTTVKVNGRTFKGPLYVARESGIREISLVVMGADPKTSTQINAQFNASFNEQFNAAAMSAQEGSMGQMQTGLANMLAAGAAAAVATTLPTQPAPGTEVNAAASPQAPATPGAPAAGPFDLAAFRRDLIAASTEAATAAVRQTIDRVNEITAATDGFPEIRAKAFAEGWTTDKARLEVANAQLASIRAGRPAPGAPAVIMHAGAQGFDPTVIEAAACMQLKVGKLEQHFDARILEAAAKRFRRGVGLQEMLLEAAYANGFTGPRFRGHEREVLQASFSSAAIGGILSNVANKIALEAFNFVEGSWREIAAIDQVSDFKTITRYRMTDNMEFEEVGPSGELKHGEIGEESYTNRARTLGRMFTLTREMLRNDDLGQLQQLPARLGRGGALALNRSFWTKWVAGKGGTFWSVGNGNLATGAPSALGIDSFTTLERIFLDQKDSSNHPVGNVPAILLVPTALKVTGESLMSSLELRDNTANAKTLTRNPHAGKCRTVCSAYLNNTLVPGGSATAWWLCGDPRNIPSVRVVFLDGQQTPIIESADVDFNILGIQFRGYFDWGVELEDPKGSAKSAGA